MVLPTVPKQRASVGGSAGAFWSTSTVLSRTGFAAPWPAVAADLLVPGGDSVGFRVGRVRGAGGDEGVPDK